MGKLYIGLAKFLMGVVFIEIIIGNFLDGNISQIAAERFSIVILMTGFLTCILGIIGVIIECRKGGKNV